MAGTRPPKGQVPKDIERIKRLVYLMDNSIRIPGTNMTFGLDPIIGLVPVLGDVVDFLISAGILVALVRNGASGKVVVKMLLNVAFDTILSAIPVLGNIGDFAFKANQRNLNLAIEHYEQGKHEGSAAPILLPIIGALIVLFVAIIGFSIWVFSALFSWISSF